MRRALVALLLSGGVSACAAIWGFQDAIDLRDSGVEVTPDATDLGDTDSTVGSIDSTVDDGGTPDGDAIAPLVDAALVDAPADALEEDAAPIVVCTACAPPLPGFGWTGPYELYQLAAAVTADGAAPDAGVGGLPSCEQIGSPWVEAFDLHALPEAGLAACTCSCGSPSGAVCSAPVATYFDDPLCKVPCAIASTTIGSACTPLAPPIAGCMAIHTEFSATLEDAGTCSVDASALAPPLMWQESARLCAPSAVDTTTAPTGPASGACEAGICVPGIGSAFENTYCTVYADIVSCPDAGYAVRHAYDDAGHPYYAGAIDTRACTPCGCAPPAGVTCAMDAGTSTAMSAGTCVDPMPIGTCTSTAAPSTFATATAAPAGGACATTPDGGEPVGTVVPTAPYTICCTQ